MSAWAEEARSEGGHRHSGVSPAGSPPVALALGRLRELDGISTGAQVPVFDGVHRLLQDALATLDEV